MKVFNIFFCIIFIVFAGLQYNDPDPYVWVPIYMYTSVLCWLATKQRYYKKAWLFGITVYTLYALYKVFDANGLLDWIDKHHAANIAATMKAEQPWIEESREFFGLIILIVVSAINYFVAVKKQKTL
jgi:general stress protein CsbA